MWSVVLWAQYWTSVASVAGAGGSGPGGVSSPGPTVTSHSPLIGREKTAAPLIGPHWGDPALAPSISSPARRRCLPSAAQCGPELSPPLCWLARLLCGWDLASSALAGCRLSQSLHTIQPKTSCIAQLRPIYLYSLSPQLKCTHRKSYLPPIPSSLQPPRFRNLHSLESWRNGGRDLCWRSEVSTGGDERGREHLCDPAAAHSGARDTTVNCADKQRRGEKQTLNQLIWVSLRLSNPSIISY